MSHGKLWKNFQPKFHQTSTIYQQVPNKKYFLYKRKTFETKNNKIKISTDNLDGFLKKKKIKIIKNDIVSQLFDNPIQIFEIMTIIKNIA